ncbi:MAG: hypothetical protein AB7F83_13670, partial [Lysobacterales bacterium]
MSKLNYKRATAIAMALALALSGSVSAQVSARGDNDTARPADAISFTINPNRGVDALVDYAALAAIGPWDDRNYQLRKEDLKLLSPNEADAIIAIPAFYRVEMRRANKNLPTVGPGQYPRSALNGYLAKYQGFQINGVTYTSVRVAANGGYEFTPSPARSEQVMPNF